EQGNTPSRAAIPRSPTAKAVRALVRSVLIAAGLVGSLGGCAAREPPRAAMVPWSITGDYGYSEEQIGLDRYRVVFRSPRLRAEPDPEDSHGLEPERLRVHDLALWRAAQLAKERGYSAFTVEQDNRDIDITVQRERGYSPAPYPLLFGGPWRWRNGYWPYGFWPGYPSADTHRVTATGRVKSELTVRMLRTWSAGAIDTAATLDRLRRQYGSARFPPAIYSN
ncbi:MAG: CC0125/CC1285 family lipoprotein, partial [Dongiaceae bacterium]